MALEASGGKTFRTKNLYRSAISLNQPHVDGKPVGEHPLVCRLLKGVTFSNPPCSKYNKLWDVNVVLHLFISWPDNDALSLKMLSAKLTMLLCLISIKRLSDVKALDLSACQYSPSGVMFSISKRTKINLNSVFYPYFPNQPKLCVGQCLKVYERRTSDLKTSSQSQLLISLRKPHKPVSSATLPRWVRWVMSLAGIDVAVFGAHSSQALWLPKLSGWVPDSRTLRSAVWSNYNI